MKHKIKSAMVCYENLQVRIKNKWYYMSVDKLKGLEVEGELIKKRTREWLE